MRLEGEPGRGASTLDHIGEAGGRERGAALASKHERRRRALALQRRRARSSSPRNGCVAGRVGGVLRLLDDSRPAAIDSLDGFNDEPDEMSPFFEKGFTKFPECPVVSLLPDQEAPNAYFLQCSRYAPSWLDINSTMLVHSHEGASRDFERLRLSSLSQAFFVALSI
jgi:hypothetical protein